MIAPFSDLQKHCECETCSWGGGAVALLVLRELLTGEPLNPCGRQDSGQVIRAAPPVFSFEMVKNDSSPVVFVWRAYAVLTLLSFPEKAVGNDEGAMPPCR
jgi:hypothetical protein